tara:strand:- start:2933 stop:3442 length:510 start_codon:yes stop_codon:yes gene_type:complete
MGTLSQAFESSEELFGYSQEDDVVALDKKVVYSDINELANVEPLPMYVRENNTRFSTLMSGRDPDEYRVYYDPPPSEACSFVSNFIPPPPYEDLAEPLTQDFLVVHSMYDDGDEIIINFSQMTFVDGCLIGVNAEADITITADRSVLTVCNDTVAVIDYPVVPDWPELP